ncbi:Toll-Interleukin receptor domain protein [Candidatus Magnetomorum sp. HK-1]|nr:Toll-Interleukin receptor domain protein [Candidatus Magnetomorum sp. HK-1]
MKSNKKIFISYERGDFEIASRLYYDLKKHGLSPWLDKIDLFVGQNWKLAIKKAIRESDYFLALLSRNSISKKGYVQKELKIALEMLDELVESDIFIIPVRLDECRPNDQKLQDIHWADLYPSYEDGLKLILKAFDIDTGEPISDEDKSEIPFMRYGTKIKPYSQNEINEILEKHRIWIESKKEKGEQAIFINADLRKFDFSNVALPEANFQEANLQEANFQNANLQKATFREAHLYSVNFKNANLEEADLTEAYLHDTNMQNTNLQSANLERAMLNESFLIHTKLAKTKLTGAILKNIKTDITTISMIPNELIEIFGNSFFVQGWTDFKKNNIIERHIIFPPEYQQAGMSVLTYFNSILIDKYPDTKVSVTIKQENLKVTMIVETPEGKKEEIQKTLDQFEFFCISNLA